MEPTPFLAWGSSIQTFLTLIHWASFAVSAAINIDRYILDCRYILILHRRGGRAVQGARFRFSDIFQSPFLSVTGRGFESHPRHFWRSGSICFLDALCSRLCYPVYELRSDLHVRREELSFGEFP